MPWSAIQQRALQGQYSTLHDFDGDMTRLFERARRWFRATPDDFGRVVTLQRLYNALTAPYPLQVPPNGVIGPSPTKFASLPAGPGVACSVQDRNEAIRAGANPEQVALGITTSHIEVRDRLFTDEARHKGVAYRVGDYVHLINPNDASRPIVGQIFKTFVPTKGYATHHVTVCWYFRPEQTVHPAELGFAESEVFKTAHFCDHPVEDILERVAVQPTDSAMRGRPAPPAFFPGWQLYVCNTRYIDKAALFMRIKKWSNIVPESQRHIDVTAVVPYERLINLPSTRSPFASGVKGPGGIGRPRRQPMPTDDEEEEAAIVYSLIAPPRRPSGPQPGHPSSRGSIPSMPVTPQAPVMAPRHPYPVQGHAKSPAGPSRTPSHGQQVAYGQQQVRTPVQHQQQHQQHPQHQQQGWRSGQPVPAQAHHPQQPVRTFASVMGGAQVLEQVAVREYLLPDTARLFEQDQRHQVLWFSGPPVAQGAIKIPTPQPHSLEYLTYVAKRKNGSSKADARPGKRFRSPKEEEAKEEKEEAAGEDELAGDLTRHWWAEGQTEEQVLAGLKAIAQGA